jgi:cell fate (sporulation/competence/biofilm development) regulator YmcA (YheA/YmcA/DUF963 family)
VTFLEEEKQLEQEVEKLLDLLKNHESVQQFQTVRNRAENHPKLKELEAQIKAAQKDAVNFEHYGKPEAQRQAVAEINRLNKEYKSHPLVESYRQSLIEADELLQHVSTMIQKNVNQVIEGEEE